MNVISIGGSARMLSKIFVNKNSVRKMAGGGVGLQLAGRLALVTGGGSGIGRSICEVFARNGASVVVADISVDNASQVANNLATDSGPDIKHHSCSVDVGDSNAVKQMVKETMSLYGRAPCIAVNSAGITKDSFMVSMEESSFDEVIRVNLKGTFLVTQAISVAMLEQGVERGSIINLGSISGKVGNIGQCNYAASKAGVEGLTKSAAKELALHGIRCNAVLPGFIKTPMTETVPEKVVSMMKKMIPAGRMGEPSEVAEACLFLASDQSGYITGTTIEVTGGLFA
ncbi:estradiol 17-beta-dehydrogenase 8-like [Anneissia japonica]|uniref:estradiol 17-beta-dehydrogenase 8-like n=1 Tax=Anneissia japonica TaxID=1529436 RepID=UPI001425557C|nr:estradiol 17-beta-dehydrogenase 8-like [Anneissia japonica]